VRAGGEFATTIENNAVRRASREINTLSLSALDLFATAMGAFAIIMLILFPHYNPKPKEEPPLTKDPRPDKPFLNSLGMKFVPVPTGPITETRH
jgi:hypothetical protein